VETGMITYRLREMHEILNPEIPGLELPNPGILGLRQMLGIQGFGIGIPIPTPEVWQAVTPPASGIELGPPCLIGSAHTDSAKQIDRYTLCSDIFLIATNYPHHFVLTECHSTLVAVVFAHTIGLGKICICHNIHNQILKETKILAI
jgi:hypothetical protein